MSVSSSRAESAIPSAPMVAASNLTKTVQTAAGPLTILQNINIAISAGESLAVIGASGSGKTTLLGILAGLDVPSSGSVALAGEELTHLDEDCLLYTSPSPRDRG